MSSGSCSFINLSANEIVTIYNFDDEEYKEEIQLEIDNNRDNYLKLPEQYEMDNYNRMLRFIDSLDNVEYQRKLLYTIQGKGAFRRFKDALIMLNIRNKWFDFKKDELVDMARKILEENEIEYEDDLI